MIFDDFLYRKSAERIKEQLGENWCGPDFLPHAQQVRIAVFMKEKDSDGYDVELYATAMPATFYAVKALDSKNSVGENQKGFLLTTGSGELDWAIKTAKKIVDGMVGCKITD